MNYYQYAFPIIPDFGNEIETAAVGFHPVINTKDILYTLTGDVSETLQLDAPLKGIYIVEITSTKSDSYVDIFATTSPHIDRPTELPKDSNVSILDKTQNTFTVSWNPSPNEEFDNTTEYCVAVNRKRSYKTLCSVLSHLNGDPKPTLPPNNGFGFSSEILKERNLRKTAKPVRAQKKGSIFFKCLGRNTKATFEKVKTRKGYYVDVFVKSSQTNGGPNSRHYNGIYIKTKRKRKLPSLKEGKIRTVVFSRRKRKFSYMFQVKKSTRDVHLAISSCSGTLNVQVKGTNGSVYNSRLKSSKVLTFKALKPGKYNIALSKKVTRKNEVYISVSTKRKIAKIPDKPEEKTVKVFDYLTTCESVTVAWKGTDVKQNYCLYKTELPSSRGNSSSISKKLDECGALNRLRNGAQKITCKNFKYRSQDNAVLAITVTNLKQDTSYIFDVFVSRGKYFTFPYNSVRTKTKSVCYLPT